MAQRRPREHLLVGATWVDQMHRLWVDTGGDPPFQHYGLAVWAGPRDCWRLDGRHGQYVMVDEARDAVITITADAESRDHLLAELAAEALNAEQASSR